MSKFLLGCLIVLLFGACVSHGYPIPFNITDHTTVSWDTDEFTKVIYTFLTADTSGVAIYQDLSEDAKQFKNYDRPAIVKDYTLFGVFQMNLTGVTIPSSGAKFSFKHDFSFGILNVNPKQACLVGVDLTGKKFTQIDFTYGPFYNEIILPLEHSIYTFGIMGLKQEISAQFGVPTLVNYRASLKYELHKDLNQYLSCFVNRPLTYPAYDYTAKIVDNRRALPSSDMIEIVSFSFNPMFKASYSGSMVVRDFEMTFNKALGFVDKNGQRVDIDYNSLDCLYVVKGVDGFKKMRGSAVFPGWQKLACGSPQNGMDDVFPEYVTIVGSKKQLNPDSPPSPIIAGSHKQHPRENSIPSSSMKMINSVLSAVVIVSIALILN